MLTVAGITSANGIDPEARIDVAGLGKFAELCLRNQTCIEETLSHPVRKDVAKNPVRQLNAFLKLGGLRLDPLIRKKRQQKSHRLYGFETNYFVVMMALAAKFQSPDAIQERLRALRD